MIVVVADDFSGAAEVAGAAFQFGLSVAVRTEVESCDADVLVIDTNSRTLDANVAAETVARVSLKIGALRPTWIFKKVDSVLRGPVAAEIDSMGRVLERTTTLLVCANPQRGRCVRSGLVWIGDRLLHQTEFARDPDYPARTSSVLDLLGPARLPPTLVASSEGEFRPGFNIGNANTSADLAQFAKRLDGDVLPAGGVEFFEAILRDRTPSTVFHVARPLTAESSTLIVCGSAAGWPQRLSICAKCGVPIFEVVSELCNPATDVEAARSIEDKVRQSLLDRGTAMLAISRSHQTRIDRIDMTQRLARSVRWILAHSNVAQLLIEGGATASAIVRACQWPELRVADCFAPGVVGLRCPSSKHPLVVVKPGSYEWPDTLYAQFLAKMK